jgi:hypothetical protein
MDDVEIIVLRPGPDGLTRIVARRLGEMVLRSPKTVVKSGSETDRSKTLYARQFPYLAYSVRLGMQTAGWWMEDWSILCPFPSAVRLVPTS